MKKLLILIISIIVITMIGCDNVGGCDNVERPFDVDRFDKDGYAYVEKYSEKFWSDSLDAFINSPKTKEHIEKLKTEVDSLFFNTNYLLLAKDNAFDYDIWYLSHGEDISLIWSEDSPSFYNDFKKIPECILERYIWPAEVGGWDEIYYLRKGKQLIPVRYIYLPKDFEWME